MSKKKIADIKVTNDVSMFQKEYELDTKGSLIKIELDEIARELIIFRRKKEYTDKDNSNIFNISSLFTNYLSSVNLIKDENDLLVKGEQLEEVIYYDEDGNIESKEYITKDNQIQLFTIKEFIIEDGKLVNYKTRELEIAERERDLNLIKNLTVSINGVMTDNVKDLNKVLFQEIE